MGYFDRHENLIYPAAVGFLMVAGAIAISLLCCLDIAKNENRQNTFNKCIELTKDAEACGTATDLLFNIYPKSTKD